MAQTQRSIADLYASIIPDNSANLISAEDLRDAVETLRPRIGGYYFSSSANTTINTISVYELAAGTTAALAANDSELTVSASNRITYTGAAEVRAMVQVNVGIDINSGSQDIMGVWLYKNGSAITGAEIQNNIISSGRPDVFAIQVPVDLVTNDYLEIYVANHAATSNIAITMGTLTIITAPK